MTRATLFIALFAFSLVFLTVPANGARPVYNIAHMVNTRSQIDEWLGYGANAIETDMTFDEDGTPKYLYHGFPCDVGRNCWRWDYIPEYIQAIQDRTVPSSPKFNPNFVLLMFDLKLRSVDKSVLKMAAEKFADVALIPLYNDKSSKLKVLLSIYDTSMKDFITGLLAHLKAKRPDIITKIGFEINSEKNLLVTEDLVSFLKSIGVRFGHVWLSKGTTNWFFPLSKQKIIKKLKDLVQYKESGNGYVSKVYAWTVNFKSTIKSLLETGIDGLITNNPRNFVKAMEDFNGELRLATLEDDPFER